MVLFKKDITAYYQATAQRTLSHLIGALWVGAATLIALGFVEVFTIRPIPRHLAAIYGFDTALNFGLCQYLLVERLGRLDMVTLSVPVRRRVGKELLLAAVGVLCALGIQHTFLYFRVDNYAAPIFNYFEMYPLRMPGLIQTTLFFTVIWGMAICGRLAYALRLSVPTAGPGPDYQMDSAVAQTGTIVPDNDAGGTVEIDGLRVRVDKKMVRLRFRDILYITVEGQYCRFYLQGDAGVRQVFAHISMKQVLAKLPAEVFIQIHRSHVVNKRFTTGLTRQGRSYRLDLIDNIAFLPVSRHRIKQVRCVLEI